MSEIQSAEEFTDNLGIVFLDNPSQREVAELIRSRDKAIVECIRRGLEVKVHYHVDIDISHTICDSVLRDLGIE